MNLVLIGYRGVGKSVIGNLLAARLDMPCVSFDAEIVQRAGCSIPELVAASGWDHFREMEHEVTRDYSRGDNRILDTGGGVILRPDNVSCLKQNGMLFWLTAPAEVIVERIGDDTQRPSLTGTRSFTEEVEAVLAQRIGLYEKAADVMIDTAELTPEQAAAVIDAAFQAT